MILTSLDRTVIERMLPGQHVIVLSRDPVYALEGRRLGLELRDTLLILSLNLTEFAFLFRKELEGTVAENVLKYGMGGLWIDGCRVGTDTVTVWATKTGESCYGQVVQTNADKCPTNSHTGRWPTNLVLIHGPECQQSGMYKIRGNRTDTRPQGDGGRDSKEHWRIRPTEATRRGYSDEDGTETVAAWDCQDGCPVTALDQQSGILKSGWCNDDVPIKPKSVVHPDDFGASRITGQHYGDDGGASRFFPQFAGRAEMMEWLERLMGV